MSLLFGDTSGVAIDCAALKLLAFELLLKNGLFTNRMVAVSQVLFAA
jgi:hypothetical protein